MKEVYFLHDEEIWTYKYTKMMVNRPKTALYGCMGFIFICVIIASVIGSLGMSSQGSNDWTIPTTDESRLGDALKDARTIADELGVGDITQKYASEYGGVSYYYESEDGTDIFTASRLQTMCQTEEILIKNPEFPDFCKFDGDGDCEMLGSSIVVYFYGFQNTSIWNCDTLLSNSVVTAKSSYIYSSLSSPEGIATFGFFVDDGTVDRGYSTRTASSWSLGSPLPGFTSSGDDEAEQILRYKLFLASNDGSVKGTERSLFEFFGIALNEDSFFFKYFPTPYRNEVIKGGLRVHWYSIAMQNNEFTRLLNTDTFFSMFSLMFVGLWIRFHTGSFFLTQIGMFQIIMSIPFGMLIYKNIYGIPFFSSLHVLVIFIVLGVGADDIFVYVDAWKQSEDEVKTVPGLRYIPDNSIEKLHWRMHRTFRHTMSAVFNTSFSTAFAFLSTAFSPLMPISTFGIFAATTIVLNYIFVMTLMPPAVILAQELPKYCCCGPVEGHGSNKDDETATNATDVTTTSAATDTTDAIASNVGVEVELTEEERLDAKVDIFTKYYISIMTYKVKDIFVVAWGLVIFLFVYGVYNSTEAVKLTPPKGQEQWFPTDHMFTQVTGPVTSSYLLADEAGYTHITLAFGIKNIDRGNFNIYEPEDDRGKAEFDDEFNLASPGCQQAVLKICEDIPTHVCSKSACGPTQLMAQYNSTRCFMTQFNNWADTTLNMDTLLMNETFFYDRLNFFRTNTTPSDDPSGNWQEDIGFVNGELKFVTVEFLSTLKFASSSTQKKDMMDNIDSMISDVQKSSFCDSCSCSSFFDTAPFVWNWYNTEQGLVFGLYQGMSISFPMAFFVLFFATGNVVLSLYAILSIFFIVFGVLGFVRGALGWDLGVAESVAGIIIIGFSVDYTVHLGNEYMNAEDEGIEKRLQRFIYASKRIVSTVAAGAMTTGGAGLFMFPAQLMFFVKMATLMVGTIVLSYLYALGFFMGLCIIAGPERDQGKVNISCIKRWLGIAEKNALETEGEDAGKGGSSSSGRDPEAPLDAGDLELTTAIGKEQ